MHRSRFGLIVVSLLLSVSCAPVVEQADVAVDVPGAYSEKGSVALPDKWWLSFKDRQLANLIEEALQENFTLMVSWDRLMQARAIAVKSGAARYPDLTGTAAFSVTEQKADGKRDGDERYLLGLAASYELDVWGRVRSISEATMLDAKASEFDLHSAAISLSAQVAITWYQLVENYGQFELLQKQIRTNIKALEIITVQVRAGKVGIADMLQQRQLIESNYGERAKIEAEIRLFEHQLAVLLGKTPDRRVASTTTTLIDLPSLPETGLPADLLARRPDIRSAYSAVLAADKRLAAAIADKYPRFSITARLETSGDKTRDLFSNWLSSLAANLSAPLFDGGERQAEVERSESVAAEKLHLYSQVILEAFAEVEDGLAREKQQLVLLDSLEKQLELAFQAIERIRGKYLQGALDYQRVLTALLSHQQVERRLIAAKRELLVNRINLCRALGGGWELEIPRNMQNDNE